MTLNLTEAAAFLHLHPNTVQERAKRGIIPGAAKPGKCWVFLEDGLRGECSTSRTHLKIGGVVGYF